MSPRTADFIEEANSLKSGEKSGKRGNHPKSLANLKPYQFPKGISGNPGGKPRVDVARIVAQQIFENNPEGIYNALGKALLKGNAYVFKELAERAFGKLKEVHEVKHVHEDVPDTDLQSRIDALVRDIGLARQVDEAGRTQVSDGGAGKTNGKAKDTPVLS